MYLLVFIQNLLVHLGEKILLMQPLTFGGDYPATLISGDAAVHGTGSGHSVTVLGSLYGVTSGIVLGTTGTTANRV
ncbi:MAG: hypothetical protein WAN48_03770, partial [Actinomycetes bacterium]